MTALSKVGARRLAEAEEKIERGLGTFMEVGAALESIRDERLYRAEHDTFEDYCRERWAMSARRANQLMSAMEIGTIVPVANEGQARALAPVKDDPIEVQEVYAEAEKRGDTTAAGLSRVVAERHPKVDGGGEDVRGGPSPASPSPSLTVGPGETQQEPGPSPAASPAPPTPAQGGTEGYRAACTKARSTVRSHLLTLDPERVIATADEPDHWRQFSEDVRGWLDELDEHLSGPALKAVQ